MAAPAPVGQIILGPFEPSPALTVYLVNDRPVASAHLSLGLQGKNWDRWMVRAFDPEEELSFWRFVDPASAPLEQALTLKARGVHQVRVTAGQHQSKVTLTLPQPLGWGVSFQNGTFEQWRGQPATMYVYVPPHAEEFEFSGLTGSVRITDESGKQLVATTAGTPTKAKVPVAKTDVVWRVDFSTLNRWSFRAAGFPVILCPTPAAARTIRASVEVMADGTVVTHKFQRRIRELLPELLQPKNVGVGEQLVVPLTTRTAEWVKEPFRNRNLLYDVMPSIPLALRQQNVDTTNHWAGTFTDWAAWMKLPPPQNRWDRLKSVAGLESGLSIRGHTAENLARVALLDDPINPYFGKRELLYRAAAIALTDLLMVGEDEVWRGKHYCADMDPYPGTMAFVATAKAGAFALAAPHMSKEVRAVWTDALRHVIDRHVGDLLTTARNQSSHYLVTLQAFAEGSGDPRYKELAEGFAKRFVAGQHPSGFHSEELGPDGGYIGMTHWHEAVYYRMSKNPLILDSLRRSYSFFNHTVAPEPDGRVIGASNFDHRTTLGFEAENWGGARGILDDILPEVGLWAPPAATAAAKAQAATGLTRTMSSTYRPSHNSVEVPRYLYWSQPDRTGVWPAKEPKSFTRDIGGQMVAVKRPGYYAMVYVGKPATIDRLVKREGLRSRFPNDAEDNGGEVVDYAKATAFLGGGLSLFWTPAYGNALLATSWSPLTHHGLVATAPDGKRYWEDYLATSYRLDAAAGTLEISGRIEKQPVAYTRSYRFADDAIEVRVKLKAEQAVALAGLFENVPVARGTAKADGAEITVAGKGFQVLDKHKQGMEVTLDQARPLRAQPNGLKNGFNKGDGKHLLQIGRVEIELPAKLTAGQETSYSYTLRPTRTGGRPAGAQ